MRFCTGGVLIQAGPGGGGHQERPPTAARTALLHSTRVRLSQCPVGLAGWAPIRSAGGQVVRPSRLSARVTAEVPLRCMPSTTTPDLSCVAQELWPTLAGWGGGVQGAATDKAGARPASGSASARNSSLTL